MSDARDLERFGWGPRPPAPGPWRPPTGVWPPCPPGPPRPPWPPGLEQCWDDVRATKAFFKKIIAELIAEDPSLIGLAQPIIGVTDGSDAQPGQVGEFVRMDQSFPFTAAPQSQVITMGVLSPGDWDVSAWLSVTTQVTGIQFLMTPVPAGFSDNLAQVLIANTDPEYYYPNSHLGRALTSIPSLIAFTVGTNSCVTGPDAGTGYMTFAARRRR